MDNCIISGFETKKVVLNDEAYIQNCLIENEVTGDLKINTLINASVISKDYDSYILTTDYFVGDEVGDSRWTLKSSETGGLISDLEQNSDMRVCVSGNRIHFAGISGNVTVDVFAINGSAVLKKTGDGESVSFELPSGFYVLRVVSGKQVNVFRVSVR